MRCFLAGLAETSELQQVAVNSESTLPGKPFFQFAEIMAGEINNSTAVGADQVVVMLWSTNCVAVTAASGMQLTDEFQLGEYLKGAVDGRQPDARVVLVHLLMYGGRSKVVLAGYDCPYHHPSLWSKLIAMLPQCSYYFPLCKLHLKF